MKRRLSYIFSTLVIAGAMILPTAALAQATEGSSGSTAPSQPSTGTTSDSSGDTTHIETENHTMEDRINKFKTNFKINLTADEMSRIKLKCVGAQTIVGDLHTKFGDKITPRTKAYTELQTRLNNLVTKLKAKSVDTTTLEAEITTLNTKIATFNTDLTAYKQALSDLKDVNCKTDPTGFQAALQAARSAHNTLVSDALAIRTYLVNTIKPTLQDIKKQLDAKASSTTSGGNN